MKWLERYLLLERVMMDLDDEGEHLIGDLVRDAIEPVWPHLSSEDINYLKGRGMLAEATDLDKVKPPTHIDVSWWSLSTERIDDPRDVMAAWLKRISRYANPHQEWADIVIGSSSLNWPSPQSPLRKYWDHLIEDTQPHEPSRESAGNRPRTSNYLPLHSSRSSEADFEYALGTQIFEFENLNPVLTHIKGIKSLGLARNNMPMEATHG